MSTEGTLPNAEQIENAVALLELAAEQGAELYETALHAQHNKSDERAQLMPATVAMCTIPVHRNISDVAHQGFSRKRTAVKQRLSCSCSWPHCDIANVSDRP